MQSTLEKLQEICTACLGKLHVGLSKSDLLLMCLWLGIYTQLLDRSEADRAISNRKLHLRVNEAAASRQTQHCKHEKLIMI